MKLLTKSNREKLLRNGRIREALEEDGRTEADFIPIVKLFMPDAQCTWILTELDPDDPDIAFGLAISAWAVPNLAVCVSRSLSPCVASLACRWSGTVTSTQGIRFPLMPAQRGTLPPSSNVRKLCGKPLSRKMRHDARSCSGSTREPEHVPWRRLGPAGGLRGAVASRSRFLRHFFSRACRQSSMARIIRTSAKTLTRGWPAAARPNLILSEIIFSSFVFRSGPSGPSCRDTDRQAFSAHPHPSGEGRNVRGGGEPRNARSPCVCIGAVCDGVV